MNNDHQFNRICCSLSEIKERDLSLNLETDDDISKMERVIPRLFDAYEE